MQFQHVLRTKNAWLQCARCAAYSWWTKQIKPQRREQIIIFVIFTVTFFFNLSVISTSSNSKNKQAQKCENEYKRRGVAVPLQEQTDSWKGWGGQWRQKKKTENICQNFTSEMPEAHQPTKCHWYEYLKRMEEFTACNSTNAFVEHRYKRCSMISLFRVMHFCSKFPVVVNFY